ncbi:hypothetical protein BDR04DRAFT_1122948 [Suillus decipiens]|nr:hypothetical protein BDR04DRAFT_1122948 [Suillus decipiens]
MPHRRCRSAPKKSAHDGGVDTSQAIGFAGDHKTRGFPSHPDGSGSISSCALLLPNSIVTSSGGRDIDINRGGQKANLSVASARLKPLRIKEALKPSKEHVMKMLIRQYTRHLERMDPPIGQAEFTPKAGKKKRKRFYKKVKKFREPVCWKWKGKAEEDLRLLNIAEAIWIEEVGDKAAEYRRRMVAKKRESPHSVSRKWMEKKENKKENKNREARHKEKRQRQFVVNANKAHEYKLRVVFHAPVRHRIRKRDSGANGENAGHENRSNVSSKANKEWAPAMLEVSVTCLSQPSDIKQGDKLYGYINT